jgi:hypothetical protein
MIVKLGDVGMDGGCWSAWNRTTSPAALLNFQKLICTGYCAILLHVGNAKDTVYAIMERDLGGFTTRSRWTTIGTAGDARTGT